MTNVIDISSSTLADDTLNAISEKYREMKNNGDLTLNNPFLSDLGRGDIIHTLLISMTDEPNEKVMPENVLKLAALTASWVEVLFNG